MNDFVFVVIWDVCLYILQLTFVIGVLHIES